jgi:hypothetical protein
MLKEAVVAQFNIPDPAFFEGTEKPTNDFSQDSRSPSRNLNPGPSEYEAECANLSTTTSGGALHVVVFKFSRTKFPTGRHQTPTFCCLGSPVTESRSHGVTENCSH